MTIKVNGEIYTNVEVEYDFIHECHKYKVVGTDIEFCDLDDEIEVVDE